jgi:transcriptional regulator with PAS, ATPase and Fis domain
VAGALDALAGAAIVLDPALRVVVATPSAEALLGFPIPRGESAPKLLCGESPKRPVAEALAEGRAIDTRIPRSRSATESRMVRVRSLPFGVGKRSGALLLLEDAGEIGGDGPVLFHGMWTEDAGMKQVFRIVERVADTDATVLVRGETGAGKELVAHALHALSPRKKGPFRALSCAALPPSLLESELFGHARGAFTGAVRDVPGHVQLAHGGTLFLDEVAELPLELQAKLLRVLETRTVVPVGAREAKPVDVRIVSATHRALRGEVEAGRFRADLMFRLRVVPIYLPPLRARKGDVRLLAERFVEQMNAERRRRVERISPAAMRLLEAYDFPGNVRELRNALAYAYAVGDGPVLAPTDLPPELSDARLMTGEIQSPAPAPPPSPEAQRVAHVLERTAGNRERAAKILGISRVTLWRHMRALGLLPS